MQMNNVFMLQVGKLDANVCHVEFRKITFYFWLNPSFFLFLIPTIDPYFVIDLDRKTGLKKRESGTRREQPWLKTDWGNIFFATDRDLAEIIRSIVCRKRFTSFVARNLLRYCINADNSTDFFRNNMRTSRQKVFGRILTIYLSISHSLIMCPLVLDR